MNQEELLYSLPVEHLSYSALKTYCSNRAMFKKIYILQQGDFNVSPSMMVGKMAHKFAEFIFEGEEYDVALDAGYAELDRTPDSNFFDPAKVDREKIKQEYMKAVTFFMEEKPNVGEVVATELNVTTDFVLDGKPAPLPIKAVTDLVTRMPDGIHLWDYKFTSRPREADEEQPDYILQSVFNRITVGSHLGEEPKAMHYVQVKTSKNRDGGSQVDIYTIEFDKHPEYFTYFDRMYRGFIKEVISPSIQFLPNFGDHLNGKEAWQEFTEGLVDFELPAKIDHSTGSHIQRNKKIRDDIDFIQSKATLAETPIEEKIRSKLLEFAINLQYVEKFVGSNVTLYTYEASRGVSMTNLQRYESDLELVLGAESVVIHAPLKGKKLVGIEVSNESQRTIEFDAKRHMPKTKNNLQFAVGEDVYNNVQFADIASTPHMLVAGATGMGKSVFLNVLLTTILQNNDKKSLEVFLVDPKGNEFFIHEDDPKVVGVYSEIAEINELLRNVVGEMKDRYEVLREAKVRDIKDYHKMGKSMPRQVIVVDELADLILSKETYQVEEIVGEYADGSPKVKISNKLHSKDIENSLTRLAQKARAVGIHLVCATQRPSADVVLGVLKANFPTRVAFATVTSTDSGVILDQSGAEKLIGNGDLLLMSKSSKYLERLQGIFI